MDSHNALSPVYASDIGSEKKHRVVPSHMFLKHKFDAESGAYVRTKARFVAQGNHQRPDTYGNTSSKMVNILVVFVLLKIMAALDLEAATFDITGAYLNAPRSHPECLFMRLIPSLTTLWLTLHPEHTQYVHNGALFFKVNKAIYGLKDAGFDFYVYLSSYLLSRGYGRSESDPCLFLQFLSWDNLIYIATWVDDLFVVGRGALFDEFSDVLRVKFTNFTCSNSDAITFLGMSCKRDRSSRHVSISQSTYITDLLQEYQMSSCNPVTNPCTVDFLATDSDSPLCDAHTYLSLCMALMYLARISRPDILFPVTYLATKSSRPTISSFNKLKRILRYLAGTLTKAIILKGSDLTLTVYADASYGLHPDGRGHSGLVATVGGDPIFSRSTKQKCVALSSTEAEIIALCDAATYLHWLVLLLAELRLPQASPVTMFQDNQSSIHMVQHGLNFQRSKHVT
eukprot:gene2934-3594_t